MDDADHPLRSDRLSLVPLQRDHREDLLRAPADGRLWDLRFTNVPGPDTVDAYLETALVGRAAGTVIPYAIEVDSQVVGSTRFWKLDRANRKVEIGHS